MSFFRRGGQARRLHYPRRLRRGGAEEIGSARVSLSEDGLVEACDPHGCSKVRVPIGVEEVLLEPVPPFNRPQRLTGCIYVELEEPLVYPGGRRARFWFLAPYEVAVVAGGVVVAYVSPIPTKYTLVGDVVGGSVCRYYRSRVAESPDQIERMQGLAYVAADLGGDPALVPGFGFYAAGLPIYTDAEAKLYYPRLEAEIKDLVMDVKTTQEAPMGGLQLAQHGRRLMFLAPVFQVPLSKP